MLGLGGRVDAWCAFLVQSNDRQRQMDGKGGAFTFAFTYGGYHTAVQFHELLADRQPQSEAAKGPRGRGIFLRESVKNVRQITDRNPHAGIADAQFQM